MFLFRNNSQLLIVAAAVTTIILFLFNPFASDTTQENVRVMKPPIVTKIVTAKTIVTKFVDVPNKENMQKPNVVTVTHIHNEIVISTTREKTTHYVSEFKTVNAKDLKESEEASPNPIAKPTKKNARRQKEIKDQKENDQKQQQQSSKEETMLLKPKKSESTEKLNNEEQKSKEVQKRRQKLKEEAQT